MFVDRVRQLNDEYVDEIRGSNVDDGPPSTVYQLMIDVDRLVADIRRQFQMNADQSTVRSLADDGDIEVRSDAGLSIELAIVEQLELDNPEAEGEASGGKCCGAGGLTLPAAGVPDVGCRR